MIKYRYARRHVLACLAGAAFCYAAPSIAQSTFPTQPIKWIVPFAAGGGSDTAARIIATELSVILKQPVVVDNKPGGNTIIATQALLASKPDGYTIMSASNDTLTINPHLQKVTYQIDRDFEYVALFVKFPTILVAKKDFPADDARQAVEYLRKTGPTLNYASYGNGSVAHIGMEMLLSRLGTKSNHVPYKGGAPAIQDMVGGRVDLMMDVIPSSVPFVKSGNLKALAWTGKERNPALPNVMTLQEAGVAGFDFYSWQGIIAPRGTPPATVAALTEGFRKALASPEVRQSLDSRGIEASFLDGPAFRKLAETGSTEMKKAITTAHITFE